MSNATKDHITDRGFAARPIYLTDLDRCQPAGALSPEPAIGRWKTVSYATDELAGVMVAAGTETAAPDITYPLNVPGWHAVSVGVWADHITPGTTRWYGELRTFNEVQIKRSGDDTFSILTLPGREWDYQEHLCELYWNVVDLTGHDLVLGQVQWRIALGDSPGALQSANCRIAYIKLVPLSDEETAALQAERENGETRTVFAHNDGGPPLQHRPTTAAEVRRHVEHYRDTDVSRLYWEAGAGDHLNYFSKLGRVATFDGLDDFGRYHHRLEAESLRILRDKGLDPFKIALDAAHDMGLEFHAGYRVAGFQFPPLAHGYYNRGQSFYKTHPELRGEDRDGNRTPRMAYSYPETRRYVVSLLREMVEMGCDGVCLLYNRRPPLVEYEPPLVDGFRAEYGEDPRQIADDDPRWLSYRATFLTRFMREVREELDAVAEEQGRSERLRISAVAMATIEENLYNAMDLKAWIDEGLIDTMILYSSFPNLESLDEAWTDERVIQPFVSLTKGTACELAANILPRQLGPEAVRKQASRLYRAGVENLFIWDSDVLQPRSNSSGSSNAIRRLGHRDEIEAWIEAGEPDLGTPILTLRRMGDWDLSYRTPA